MSQSDVTLNIMFAELKFSLENWCFGEFDVGPYDL